MHNQSYGVTYRMVPINGATNATMLRKRHIVNAYKADTTSSVLMSERER